MNAVLEQIQQMNNSADTGNGTVESIKSRAVEMQKETLESKNQRSGRIAKTRAF